MLSKSLSSKISFKFTPDTKQLMDVWLHERKCKNLTKQSKNHGLSNSNEWSSGWRRSRSSDLIIS